MDVKTIILNVSLVSNEEDCFAKIYDNPILNLAMLVTYLVGLVGCTGLVLISWYEKTGQAGHFRTVVDQLVSSVLDHLVIAYLSIGVDNIRIFWGPLPVVVCKIASVFKILTCVNISALVLAIVCIKFYLINIRKSVPVMDDNLIAIIIVSTIMVINTLATFAKIILDERLSIIQAICVGNCGVHSKEGRFVPLVVIIGFACFALQLCLSGFVWLQKNCRKVQNTVEEGKLGSVLVTLTYIVIVFLEIFALNRLERSNIMDLIDPSSRMIVFNYTTVFPAIALTFPCYVFYGSNKHLRLFVKRIFKSEQIHPIND